MTTKKGDKFLCIKTVVMLGSNHIAYVKAKIYRSDIDGCITNEQNQPDHRWSSASQLEEFFVNYNKQDNFQTLYSKLL